ncbi:HIT family protein [Candidatus Nanohalobium constans]|uniref:Histidine triad (HIT) protein n=1 Tax=Candidatus Nanohalobium constans TaxID=2565781 RepID=A0A5Q0UEU7_9ARCH|nr:HIT family protein [Candidatus Nanohalobium constans]QGA80066.1 histidine triad (HIT) protein [Candidatus Nanohalobium constans]
MSSCLFCEFDSLAEKAVFTETDKFRVILDPFPASFGHFLIVPRQHVEKIDDVTTEEFSRVQDLIIKCKSIGKEQIEENYQEILEFKPPEKSEKLISDALNSKKNPDGFNVGINEGEAAGQTIDHLHIHVIPRYEGDVENPKGGVRNVIPDKADYT